MTIHEMMTLLGLRLEDSADTPLTFTTDFKLRALNDAQSTLARALNPGYLTELQAIKTGVTATDGILDLTYANLDGEILGGGQGVVQVKINGGLWMNEVGIDDVKKTENDLLKTSANNPLYTIFANQVQLLSATTTDIDVYFIKNPTAMIYEMEYTPDGGDPDTDVIVDASPAQGWVSNVVDYYNGIMVEFSEDSGNYWLVTDSNDAKGAGSLETNRTGGALTGGTLRVISLPFGVQTLQATSSELNPMLHPLLIDFAEAEAWAMHNKPNRRQPVYEKAIAQVNLLNEKYRPAPTAGAKD